MTETTTPAAPVERVTAHQAGGRERRAEQIPPRPRPRREGRLPPNLRSTDRPLLAGRAMIHLAINGNEFAGAMGDADDGILVYRPGFGSGNERSSQTVIASIHFFNRHPNCYSDESGTGHFCPPLAVTREIRLCLHPRGTLRVQSLHLPRWGSARRDLHFEDSTTE